MVEVNIEINPVWLGEIKAILFETAQDVSVCVVWPSSCATRLSHSTCVSVF